VSLSTTNNEAARKPAAVSVAVQVSKTIVTPANNRTSTESKSEISAAHATDSRLETAASTDKTDEENKPTQPEQQAVVWKSFGSTEAVIEASRQSRLDMRSAKQKLRAVAKSRKTPSSQDTETSQVGESVDVGAEDDDHDDASAEAASSSNEVVRLSKNDFADMEIIGQFNLGFILAKCRNNNLWILDQHACDEKFNFERLCRETVIHEQKLMAPMPLKLSVSEESCILEHLDVFEANGFRFQHDPDKPPRHRLSLTALPHSGAQDGRKAVQFGKDDVRALCAILGTQDQDDDDQDGGGTGVDGSGVYGNNAVRRYAGGTQSQLTQSSSTNSNNANKVIARLPKAIAMFANRACRGSIMIGTALSQKEMESVVRRLSEVEHPWNCPHGRPTMRHVRDLQGTLLSDETQAAELIAGPTVSVLTQEPLSQEEEDDE
jgi:DNA mismatch repair protein PMS2